MLDPGLCERPITRWTAFSSKLFDWSAASISPSIKLAIIVLMVATAVCFWAISHTGWHVPFKRLRWKKSLLLAALAFLATGVLAILPPVPTLANQALVNVLPNDPGSRVDAIVVLGRGHLTGDRAKVAADLWKADRAPQIFVSGRGDAPRIVDALQKQAIPDSVIDSEGCSQTTEENAQFTATVLQPQGIRQILLVTDSPHMLRSWLTFSRVGFQVIPHPNALPHSLSNRQRAFAVFREYAGLVSYTLQGRISPFHFPSDRATPSARQPHSLPVEKSS